MSVSSLRFPIVAIIAALLAVGLFVPGLGGGFIFDDRPNILDNASLHVAKAGVEDFLYGAYSFQPGNGSRSLSMLSFAMDYWRGGLDPSVFKTTGLFIHGLTVLALALFFRRLLPFGGWPQQMVAGSAMVLALAWAMHPLQVSSVLYIVQRMQTLVTLFMVLALWAYVCLRQAQIEGGRSRGYGLLTVLFWLLGFASKEDAALLPLYVLLLEFIVLRFHARQPAVARALRLGYMGVAFAGLFAYLFIVVPHYWSWGAYATRDFSSIERLLTQARVLMMYLGQIVMPLPDSMHFYYDDLVISRGIFEPVSTLWSLLAVAALLAWAWLWCGRRPLFAFGMLFFFAAHFMTSNVLNLELAFEHRNHLPLIGIVLAVGDLCMMGLQRLDVNRMQRGGVLLATAVAALLVTGTVIRAHDWGEPLRFARKSVELAPKSERAWLQLNNVYAERSGLNPASPDFRLALDVCQRGVMAVNSAPLLSNIIIYKTIDGSVRPQDWERFLSRMQAVPMSVQNQYVLWAMLNNVDRGIAMDEKGMLRLIDIVTAKTDFDPNQYLRLGAYIHNETYSPAKALPYLRKAVALSPADDPDIEKMLGELQVAGRADWVRELKRAKPLSADK